MRKDDLTFGINSYDVIVNMATILPDSSDEDDDQEMMATGPIPVVGQEMVGGVPKPGVTKVVVVTEPRWDPLISPDWDKEVHTKEALVRIKRDLQAIYSDPPPGICVVPEGDNLTRLHVVITGPFDTPYEGGFFHFIIRFPPTYPLVSPRVRFMTTGAGMVRFNPNLYQNGKVCLSILGTWAGPSWSAAQSLLSVLLSVQSLMSEKPYHNEPGFEHERNHGDVERYNDIIQYETLRVAVCEALESNKCPPDLLELKKHSFLEFYDHYTSTARRLSAKLEGQQMMDPFNINKGKFDLKQTIQRLETLHSKISRELRT